MKECLSSGILEIILKTAFSRAKVLIRSMYEWYILRNRNTCKVYAAYKLSYTPTATFKHGNFQSKCQWIKNYGKIKEVSASLTLIASPIQYNTSEKYKCRSNVSSCSNVTYTLHILPTTPPPQKIKGYASATTGIQH
jgi:hypothetical protein